MGVSSSPKNGVARDTCDCGLQLVVSNQTGPSPCCTWVQTQAWRSSALTNAYNYIRPIPTSSIGDWIYSSGSTICAAKVTVH